MPSILVCHNDELISIQLDNNNTLPISILGSYFAGAQNLRYWSVWSLEWILCRKINNRIHPPPNGWGQYSHFSIDFDDNLNNYDHRALFDDNLFLENYSFDPLEELTTTRTFCKQYELKGSCINQSNSRCNLVHGDLCKICNRYLLHPFNQSYRELHLKNCREKQEQLKKINQNCKCGICFQTIVKSRFRFRIRKKYFGLLENCSHVFCLDCITQSLSMDPRCPQCRIVSYRILSSDNFLDDKQKKLALIQELLEQ